MKKKKNYQTPVMETIVITCRCQLLEASGEGTLPDPVDPTQIP